ncbi:MAG: S9 family peptidase [Gemmatimonadaceae bacterium]
MSRSLVLSLAALLSGHAAFAQQQQGGLEPPVTAKHPHVTTIHGRTMSDDYFWLRHKGDSEVVHHLEAENAYLAAAMKPTEGLQKTLYDEMLERIKQTDTSASHREGAYDYFSRTKEGDQYPTFVRRRAGSRDEQVILDQNTLAKGHAFYALGAFQVSDDGNLLAFTVDTTGYRQYALRVKDLRTGKILSDAMPRVTSVNWSTDNKTLFLTTEDSITKRSDKFWRHRLGDATSTLVYFEKDELFDIYAERSRDKAMVILSIESKTSTEARYVRADKPASPLSLIAPREAKHEYYADFDDGRFYIRTNKGATNFRLVSAELAHPATGWTEVIPHRPNVKIDAVDYFRDFIVVTEREDGLPYLRVIDKKTRASHRITTPEPVYSLGLGNNVEYAVDWIQFVYTSLVTPPSTFAYNVRTRGRTLLKQQAVAGYDPAGFESKRVWVAARDGVKVPVALVYKKGTKFDGSSPMLLYAYGSYGFSLDPGFSSGRLSLLDRGFIYAQASIRGGGELGEPWREAGRMMKKMNTFNDFIDVADYVTKNKYTSRDRLIIEGGSAGGLLVGAVTNMRPNLFKAVVAQVPFIDVVNDMLDASLPLTTSEYIEWGNPNEKPAFDYMMKYSPYDNVKAQAYPDMLIEISYNDSQVAYWEGAKFAAKIRAMKTNDSKILVKVNMGAGHGGSSGRYDHLKEVAVEYAFMISELPQKTLTP